MNGRKYHSSPVTCEHANECPSRCPCGPKCYCKAPGNTCGRKTTPAKIPVGPAAKDDAADLASAIRKVSQSLKALDRSGVNRKGVKVLLAHYIQLGMGTIDSVLDGLASLESEYCKA